MSAKRKPRGGTNRSSARKTSGKQFYTCEYCGKTFTLKLSIINHTRKCKETKARAMPALNENILSVNNNEANQAPSSANTIKDTSIYDYNEPDDTLEDRELKENDEIASNKRCKHCDTVFENPLDLLRHTRDCHNFPRTILPPEEIEKYFDYPNRQFCPICEKPIKTRNFRSVFIKHLMVHTTGLTHQCNICKKKFRRRDHMRAHEKRHIVSV